MESVGTGIEKLIAKMLYVVEKPCPDCGGEMHAWREPPGSPPRCAPVCMACGYASKNKNDAIETQELYEKSLKAKAIKYLKYQSVLTNKSLLDCRLENFKTVDEETESAKQIAEIIAIKALNGEPVHSTLTGKTGVGKSHLAMAILWQVIEKSNYDKKCLFISYNELLEQIKFAMNDREAQKAIMGTLMNEIKAADVVVLDDLGAETGIFEADSSNVTDFNARTLTNILDARIGKPLIVTTNLDGKQVAKMYGARVLSRMAEGSQGMNIKLNTTKDKRMVGV